MVFIGVICDKPGLESRRPPGKRVTFAGKTDRPFVMSPCEAPSRPVAPLRQAGQHVEERIGAEQIDSSAQEIADPRLSHVEDLSDLRLLETSGGDDLLELDEQIRDEELYPQMTQMNADGGRFNLRTSASSADRHRRGIFAAHPASA
jgi:hypothetical protein